MFAVFDAFDESSRRAIHGARLAAGKWGSKVIEAEHLLLGLLDTEETSLFQLLTSPEVKEQLRKRLEEPKGPPIPTSVDLDLNEGARRALAYSAEEAEDAGSKTIGAQHLLAGILRDESRAATALRAAGITLDLVRERLRRS